MEKRRMKHGYNSIKVLWDDKCVRAAGRGIKLPGRPLVMFMFLHCGSDWEVYNYSLFVRSPWRGRGLRQAVW